MAVRNPEQIVTTIQNLFQDFRSKEQKTSKGTSANRLNETKHILQIAWRLLIKWSESFGTRYESLAEITKDVTKTMNRLIGNEYTIIRRMELQQQPENIFVLLFRSIDSKNIRIAESKIEFQMMESEYEQEDCFGLFHKGNLYLRDQKFLDFLQYKYKKKITKNEFRKSLEKEGLLVKDKSKNRRKKLDGESFIVIDYEGLIELLEK